MYVLCVCIACGSIPVFSEQILSTAGVCPMNHLPQTGLPTIHSNKPKLMCTYESWQVLITTGMTLKGNTHSLSSSIVKTGLIFCDIFLYGIGCR